MSKTNVLVAAACASAMFAAAPALQAEEIIAVGSGNTYSIDPATGSGSLIGPLGSFSGLNSMAKDSSGTLWGMSSDDLVVIDPETGAAFFVVTVDNRVNSVRGMAWHQGELYLIQDGGTTSDPDELWTVNVATGASTFIGEMNFRNLQGAASDGTTFYAWSIFDGLVTVDTSTGFCTDVDPNVFADNDIQTIAFDASGQLYGARNALYTISTIDGSQSFVGSGGYDDIRGMEFISGGADRLGIDVSGTCPGTMSFFVTNATPFGSVALLWALCDTGSTVPSGVCAGAPLDLCSSGLRIGGVTVADADGFGSITTFVPTPGCQGFVEWIDVETCATSIAVPLSP